MRKFEVVIKADKANKIIVEAETIGWHGREHVALTNRVFATTKIKSFFTRKERELKGLEGHNVVFMIHENDLLYVKEIKNAEDDNSTA